MTYSLEIAKEHIKDAITTMEEIKLELSNLIESLPMDGYSKEKIQECFFNYGRLTGHIGTASEYAAMANRQIDRTIATEEAKKI